MCVPGGLIMQSGLLRQLTGVVAATLIFAACSSAATPAPTAAPTAGASGPAATTAANPTPTALPGTKKFTVGFTNPGISSAPFLAALDAMRAQGYTIDTPVIESSELVVQGVASGAFAFGSGANN